MLLLLTFAVITMITFRMWRTLAFIWVTVINLGFWFFSALFGGLVVYINDGRWAKIWEADLVDFAKFTNLAINKSQTLFDLLGAFLWLPVDLVRVVTHVAWFNGPLLMTFIVVPFQLWGIYLYVKWFIAAMAQPPEDDTPSKPSYTEKKHYMKNGQVVWGFNSEEEHRKSYAWRMG